MKPALSLTNMVGQLIISQCGKQENIPTRLIAKVPEFNLDPS